MNDEAKAFLERFKGFDKSRIVFYGIGITAQAVISEVVPLGWRIVGLLDRDENNIGKVVCGIPVISYQDAKEEADVIIIMSDQSHYEVIYRRIKDLGVPVYYRSGEKAHITVSDDSYRDLKYWNTSLDALKEEIRNHEFISFDFYDTLVTRKIYEPQDVFKLLESKLSKDNEKFIGFGEVRESAPSTLSVQNPNIYDIYKGILNNNRYTREELERAINAEIEIEDFLVVPRRDVVEALIYALNCGKVVYILSDMYFTAEILHGWLVKFGVNGINLDNVIVSCDVGRGKRDTLWDYYRDLIGTGKALHIGDNRVLDIEEAEKRNIDTFYIMSGIDMLKHSSIHALNDYAVNLSDSLHLGLVIEKLFNSPFALCESKGLVRITDFKTLGYVAFGGVIRRFFNWLDLKIERENYGRALFFARDGYFLKRDFEEFISLKQWNKPIEIIYVPVSRRLVLISSVKNEQDLIETIKYPFSGTFEKYMKNRFNIEIDKDDPNGSVEINSENDFELISAYMDRYRKAVNTELEKERKNYLKLLNELNIDKHTEKSIFVDLGYKGTTQYFFEKTIGEKCNCAYFFCNFTEENKYSKMCRMEACFNDVNTPNGYSTLVGRKALFIESYLTAPYGNINYIDDGGAMVFSENRKNQLFFANKEEINAGVLDYLKDRIWGGMGLVDGKAEDGTIDVILSPRCDVSQTIMNTFWLDNDTLGAREELLEL